MIILRISHKIYFHCVFCYELRNKIHKTASPKKSSNDSLISEKTNKQKKHNSSCPWGTSKNLQTHRAAASPMLFMCECRKTIIPAFCVSKLFGFSPTLQSYGKLQGKFSLHFSALSFLPLYKSPNDL